MKKNLINKINFTMMKKLNLNRKGGRLVAALVLLFSLGIGNAWGGGSDGYYYYYYAKVTAKTATACTGQGCVYVSTSAASTSNATTESSNATGQDPNDYGESTDAPTTAGQVEFYLYANPISGYKFDGWSTSSTRPEVYELGTNAELKTTFAASNTKGSSSTSNPGGTQNSGSTASSGKTQYYCTSTKEHTVYAYFSELVLDFDVTFAQPNNGVITVNGASPSAWPHVVHTATGELSTTLIATPSDGYRFWGWYTLNGDGSKNYLSYDASFTTTFTGATTVYAEFIPSNYALFKVGGAQFWDLNEANAKAVANGGGTIVVIQDGLIVAGNYTISSGVTLYVPYSTSEVPQTTPATKYYSDNAAWTAPAPSAYRTLTLTDGSNISVASGGSICVGGTLATTNGGHWSAFVTGPCGVIDMAKGGHIELNNTATLYCWGFVRGQGMDQGNNTVGVGTITANSGAAVWEYFTVGDWRGGTACSTINSNKSTWKFFPFQSYSIQNVEVPVTYKYGAEMKNYTNVYGGGGENPATFTIIGSSGTLFLLKDSQSIVRKWYDPTTDLVCYELSGTAQLDALNITVYVSISSSQFYLPICNNMHIILSKCDMTLSKPMTVQAGSVIEVKSDATVTIASRLHLFDKDEWGMYCNGRYFYSFPNLTNHKQRGDGTSKANLEDAKLIVDGGMIVTSDGKLYSTTGGANIMGHGGGTITFQGGLPNSETIYNCTGVSTSVTNDIAAANLCNEDGSYTKSIGSSIFHNVHGRWFENGKQNINSTTHVYDEFTFISSGAVSGLDGTNSTTNAVYAPDKTGLVAGMKWCNVSQDATCTSIYNATQKLHDIEAANIRYTYQSSDWLQLLKISEGLYNGSNDNLYALEGCTLKSLGAVDENCLYDVDDTKKAYVEGSLVELTKNEEDEAWHNTANAEEYYVCFAGCTWHSAEKYPNQEKAYIVAEEDYIWYNDAWKKVEYQEPFFFDYDDQHVQVFYEYKNGAWAIATPKVRVKDDIETREFFTFHEAMNIAKDKRNVIITILDDVTSISTALSLTSANTSYTLDLNGYKVSHTITGKGDEEIGMINLNASGTTLTITDGSGTHNGELKLIAKPTTTNQTKRWHGIRVTNGSVIMNDGTLKVVDNHNKNSTSNSGRASGITIEAGKSFTMDGGTIDVESSYSTIGVNARGATGANTTVNLNSGTIKSVTTEISNAYGVYVSGGTTYIKEGITIDVTSKTSDARGIHVDANKAGYYGTLNMSGGEVTVLTTTSNPYGVYVNRAITDNNLNVYRAVADISGGTFNVTSTTTASTPVTDGIRSYGTTTISKSPEFNVTATGTYAYGVRTYDGTTTINGTPHFTVKATANAYGVYGVADAANATTGMEYHSNVTINGGIYNVSTTSKATAMGACAAAVSPRVIASGNYAGTYYSSATVTVNNGTFNVTTNTTSAYGVYSGRSYTNAKTEPNTFSNYNYSTVNVHGGTFNVTATTNTAMGATTHGYTNIDGGTFIVRATDNTAYGIRGYAGKTTVDNTNNPSFDVQTKTKAYGATCGEAPDGKIGLPYNGELEINGGEFTVKTTSTTTAYGVWVYAKGTPITTTNASNSSYYAGNYASAGTATINGGTFNVTAATTTAYGVYMSSPVSESGASGYETATATPSCTINDGTFTAQASSDAAYGAYVSNGVTLTVTDGTFKGKLTAVAPDKFAVGAYIAAGGILNATGGAFEAEAAKTGLSSNQKSYACGLYSPNGTATISASNATFKGELKSTRLTNGGASVWDGGAYGVYARTTNPLSLTNCTITGNSVYQGGFGLRFANTPAEVRNCTVNVTTTKAYNYGLFVGGASCDVKLYDCDFTCTSGTTYAYGIYAYNGATYAENCTIDATVQRTGASSAADSYLYGVLVAAGKTATLKDCSITATGSGKYSNNGYGVYVDGTAEIEDCNVTVSNINSGAYALYNTSNTTLLNVASGKYKAIATSDAASTNGTAASAKQVITGGYYSHNTNLSKYVTAPYHVFTLPTTDTEYPNGYRYEVAEAYTLAWATDGDDLTGDYTNGLTKVGATLVAPNTPTKTGYTFADWTPSVATTMPAANTTYTATWTPNTNTAYTVKHYKEKLEGGYNAEPDETDNLTGTTGAEVTPAVKNYPGFTAPEAQTVTILANGSRVVEYYYLRKSNKVTWNATENGGSCATEYTMVKTGATIGTLPEATKTGHEFLGWFTTISGGGNQVTAATMITNKITFYARFTPQTYDITYKDQGNEEFSGVHGAGYPTTHTYGTATALVNPTKGGYTFNGWYDNAGCTGAALTEIGAAAYTDDFTLYAKWTASICTITWRNYNEDFLGTSTIQPGGTPGYSTVQHGVPTRVAAGGKIYEWDGWTTEPNGAGTFYAKDELPAAAGDATYYAHFRIKSIEVEASDDIDIDEDTNVETTIVHVQGALNVAPSATLTTQDLILEATPGTSGEIIGTVEATEHAYFDLSNGAEGFKARTWYAVAVPWQVAVPAYDIPHCGVYITNDGEHYTQQELGSSFDLIYYDGALRAAQGPVNDCWRFVEDDASDVHIMYPGRAYMIYLTSDAQTIRFERKSDADLQTTTLAVDTWGTGNAKDMNWNGIANPATYHAYINANAGTYQGTANAGQIYHAESRSYSVVDLSQYDLVVGQPVFVQATAKNQSVAAISSHNVSAPYYAPRRSGNWTAPVTRYTVSLAADEAEASDRVIVCMDEDKEQDTYVIGQDLMKMGVSSVIPQLYINRYDGQMCVNTAAPVNNRTDYPLGIYVPQAGEYNLFINDQPNDETMLYLTLDGEIIWNLSYGGYVVNLDKGTTNRFGLRMIASAPQVTTGVEEALINAQGETRKVLINDKVFIIRGDNVYSADGQLVK